MQLAPMTGVQGVAPASQTNGATASSDTDQTGEAFADLLQRARHPSGTSQRRNAERSGAESRQKTDLPHSQRDAADDVTAAMTSHARRESGGTDDDAETGIETASPPQNSSTSAPDTPWLPSDMAAGAERSVEAWLPSSIQGEIVAPADPVDLAGEGVDALPDGVAGAKALKVDHNLATPAAAEARPDEDLPSPWVATPQVQDIEGAEAVPDSLGSPVNEGRVPTGPSVGVEALASGQPAGAVLATLASNGPETVAQDTGAGSAPLAEQEVRAPLHSPGFAPALGAQLTLLVKEGVTEARLHLNPAEMGPIAVQIQLDGTQARVEMVAEQAATRQVLEQSMPSLAGALRESGLTLAGGGVFEQSTRHDQTGKQGAGDGRTNGRGSGKGDVGPDATSTTQRTIAVRGMVDLYA